MNETNSSQEITLLDILKVLRNRAKNILCIALVALLVGGFAGAAFAMINNATYGAKAQFYITSQESNNYILSLLRSDSFAESLLLDANGLPADKSSTPEYASVLAIKTEADALELEKEAKELALAKSPSKISNTQRVYQSAQAEYESLCTTIFINGGIADSEAYKAATAKRDAAYNAYVQALNDGQALEDAIDELTLSIKKKKEELKKATDILLVDFRQNEDNLDKIEKIKDSVTYQYSESDNNNNQASLTVRVAVKFDRALAEEIVPKINEKLPEFVEDSIVPEKDEKKAECTVISLASEVDSANYKNPITQAIKYGAIITVVGLVAAVAVYVLIDLFIKSPSARKAEDELPSAEEDSKE